MNYLKLKLLNYPAFAFVTMFVSLILSCKSKEDPAPVPNLPPLAFNVTSSLSTNGQDVILRWNKSKDPEGDIVTYAVVYKDTLVKNLSDTTYIIKSLPFETEIKGTVVAKDTKGNKTVSSFSALTGMDYVAIPDVNFEEDLIKLKIDDVQDGKVLKSSVIKVTELFVSKESNVGDNKVKDLTGLQAFINLETFKCSYNRIKNLDLSKNTKLKFLECANNQMISIDIAKNEELLQLDCSNNQLSILDVNKNLKLEIFECSGNQITNLDISKNLVLSRLFCSGNKLTTLDVSKNILLELLYCGFNQLNNLDISLNVNLKALECSYNELTNLDIKKNSKLGVIFCASNQLVSLDVSNNTLLGALYCSNNKLVNLDVTKNVSLQDFNCSSNKLNNLDLSKTLKLVILQCQNNNLIELDLRTNISMKYLYCSQNNIKTICLKNLNQVATNWEKDPTATYKVCP